MLTRVRTFEGWRNLIVFSGIFLCAATLGTKSHDAVKVLRDLEMMLGSEFLLKLLKLLGIEFDNPATLGADHVIVMLMLVVVFVVRASVAEANFTREAGFG